MLRGIAVGAVGAVAVVAAALRPADAGAAPPAAVTGEASPIGLQTATLHATVDPGGEPTSFYFQYGTSSDYGSQTPVEEAGAGVGPQPVAAAASGLAFGSAYHFRVVATNASGQVAGLDRTFRTADVALRGSFAVRLTVTGGGAAFGQRKGQVIQRRYRITASCAGGSCGLVKLRRQGAQGIFVSRLNRHEGDRYSGVERSSGHCDDGEPFRAKASVLVYPTALSGGRAARIAGRLSIRVGGCLRAREVATFTGKLVGHG